MPFIASTLHPTRRQGLEHLTPRLWTLADRKLGGCGWCLGRYSIADVHLYRLYWRMVNAPHPYPRGLRGLDSPYQRMTGRAAVQRTIEIASRIGYELPA
jgi:glutathione S-transferase